MEKTIPNQQIRQEIINILKTLSREQHKQVLDFTLKLSANQSKQYPGEHLLKLVGTISKDDLEIMKKAIEEGCEQVDESEW